MPVPRTVTAVFCFTDSGVRALLAGIFSCCPASAGGIEKVTVLAVPKGSVTKEKHTNLF